MTPPLALWAPATTPTGAAATRRYLRPRSFTVALLALAALSVVLWFVTHAGVQLAVGFAVAAVVAFDAVSARRALRDTAMDLSANPLISTVDPLICTIRLHSAPRPVVVTPATRPSVQRFLVDGDRPGVIVLAPRRRGVVHTLGFDLTVAGPIGLVECAKRVRVPLNRSVLVGPAPLPHDVDWPAPRAVDFGLSEVAPVGDEMYRTVRPYVRGDSRRRVHWKATAHRGALMVKESDGTGIATLQVIVQLDGPGAQAEVALGRAAWIVREALSRGWRTELVTVQPTRVPAASEAALGSPFGPPPLDLAPAVGATAVVRRRVTNERAALTTLALAGYGRIDVPRLRGLTCRVTSGGDQWL